jgi:hypothetical protein
MLYALIVFVLFTSPDGDGRTEQRWEAGRTFTMEECVQRGQYLIAAVSELDGAVGGGFTCDRLPAD